jgi:uncharacterized membrane protein
MSGRRWSYYLAVAVGYFLGAVALYAGLPDGIPPRLTLGHTTLWLGAPMVAFLLPTFMVVTDVLLRSLHSRNASIEGTPTGLVEIHDAIMLRIVFFVLGVHAMMLARLFDLFQGHAWASRVVPLMLGFTIVAVGNLLPKTRPNLAIGVRTERTLSDRALWARIHRSMGYLLVTLGALLILSAIAIPAPLGTLMILIAGPAAIVAAPIIVWRTNCGHA